MNNLMYTHFHSVCDLSLEDRHSYLHISVISLMVFSKHSLPRTAAYDMIHKNGLCPNRTIEQLSSRIYIKIQ